MYLVLCPHCGTGIVYLHMSGGILGHQGWGLLGAVCGIYFPDRRLNPTPRIGIMES